MADTHWWTGQVVCSICACEHTQVIEIAIDQTEPIIGTECISCGNMSCYPKDNTDEQ